MNPNSRTPNRRPRIDGPRVLVLKTPTLKAWVILDPDTPRLEVFRKRMRASLDMWRKSLREGGAT